MAHTGFGAWLALILSVTLIDMLINAILTPYTWLIAGAVLGHCETTRTDRRARREATRGARPLIS